MKTKIKYFGLFAVFIISTQLTAAEKISWTWSLEHAEYLHSELSITNESGISSFFEFQCDLSSAISKTEQRYPFTGEVPTKIDVVLTQAHPRGLLLITCPFGAHSGQVTIIDPNVKGNKMVLQKTGSYFASWELNAGQLSIHYDTPSKHQSNDAYAAPFKTVVIEWPQVKK